MLTTMWNTTLSSHGLDILPEICLCLTVFVSIFAYLQYKNRNVKEESRRYKPENQWNTIKFVIIMIKWTLGKSSGKKPYFEHLYRSKTLKTLIDEGRLKLFKIFKARILISDNMESIKKMMHSKECNGMFTPSLANILSGGKGHRKGILWTGGPQWTELRKYTVRKLGQLGFNKSDQLSLLLSELFSDFMDNISNIKMATKNKIPVKDLFVLPTFNLVWLLVGGHKFSPGDEKFSKLFKNVDLMGHTAIIKGLLIEVLPNNKIIYYLFGLKSLIDATDSLREFMEEFVEERVKLTKPEPEDFVDYFLLEIKKHNDNPNLKDYYCKDQLVQLLVELFEAGSDTTSKFLEFSLMYMLQNPEVQKKVQMEIDEVIGSDRLPSYGDHRKRMPYTLATMMEIHRMAGIVQYFPRFTEKNWENDGRMLKKGTLIMCMVWALRMNESYWGDPATFRPERFLNEDNSFIAEKMNRVMPFSAGLRTCPGENIAMSTGFTFFVGILQKYKLTKAAEDELLGIDAHSSGLINQPTPFHMALFERLCM